ncbi:ABC transporter ATP-binding protein [Bacillaceae bacterium Marseille-Q3522]|nr:ABC transporter ATP-binding protein [Bacillaceae bacterium Marseille-Q3522]
MMKDLKSPFQYKKPSFSFKRNQGKKEKQAIKKRTETLKNIWMYLRQKRGLLFLVLSMVLISAALSLLGPYLIGRAIDNYIVEQNNDDLLRLIIALIGIYFVHALSLWLQNYWMIGIAQHTVFRMRTDLFAYLQKLPIPFFDKRQHGELMSRVTNDIENVSSTLNSSIIQILSSLLTLIGTVTIMLMLSPILTVVTFCIIPLMYTGMKWITRRTGPLFKEQQKHLGDLNGFIEETISGQAIVKTFSQEDRVIREFSEKNQRLKEASFWAQTYSGFIPKLMNFLNNGSFAVIAAVGGMLAVRQIVSIGVIVIFVEYSRQFTRPLNDLANQFNTLLSAIAGADRVFELFTEEEERDEKNAVTLKHLNGHVNFNNVSFSYEKGVHTVKNIHFSASPGETIALVGPTGAGKSTIINLIARFYDCVSGEILVDNQPMKTIKRASLREHLAFVLQDSFLFEGTIRENIRYGRLTATDEEVENAAKLANAAAFIEKLEKQYDTVLTQDGGGISKGQRQLLSIARALLRDPAILILDEATSSIDTVTEVKIQEALQRLMKGRTCFVVAHRLNTIRQADQILVLKEGEIIERGTHEQLLRQKGFYYSLNKSQGREHISVHGV